MNRSVSVGHGDSRRIYPRCAAIDPDGECQIGATYVAPTANEDEPGWLWVVLCTLHFTQWQGNEGQSFPSTSTFRLQPVVPLRRRSGSVPRSGGR